MKYFVLSDPHSYFNDMYQAITEWGFEEGNPEHKLVICGDIFDRGPNTIEMLDYLSRLGDQFIFIRGNHEDLFFDALKEFNEDFFIHSAYHYHNGTRETIYSLNRADKIDKAIDLINKSVYYYEIGDYLLVHSCVPKNYKEATLDEWREAVWGNPFLQDKIEGKTIVCGHWHCGYAHKTFEHKEGDEVALSRDIYYGDGIIGLDTCTPLTHNINVLVIDDEQK